MFAPYSKGVYLSNHCTVLKYQLNNQSPVLKHKLNNQSRRVLVTFKHVGIYFLLNINVIEILPVLLVK